MLRDDSGDPRQLARSMTVTFDGDEFVLGRPDLGIYVAVPEPGAVFITTLQSGGSLADATERASEAAGEPVDGADFLAGLTEAGLLEPVPENAGKAPREPGRTRWLFGAVAWSFYTLAALFAVATMVGRPDLRPTWESLYFLADPVLSVLVYLPFGLGLAAIHEVWHWLAARAIGIAATFRVSYRGVYLVFETDLSQIVSVPRKRRYGPFLAGMAFDFVVLALALGLRLLYRAELIFMPAVADRFLGVVVLGQTVGIAWQWMTVYLRSDGYAVLANALGCHSLYRTTWLTAKKRVMRLPTKEEAELAATAERDRAVASWFALAYVAGMLAMIWMFLNFGLPNAIGMLIWVGHNLLSLAVSTVAFWESIAVLVYVIAQYGLPPALAWRERRMRQLGVLR